MDNVKHFLSSLTLNGANLQTIAMIAVLLGVVKDQTTAMTLIQQIMTGGAALVSLIGMIATYIGRIRANPNLTVSLKSKNGE